MRLEVFKYIKNFHLFTPTCLVGLAEGEIPKTIDGSLTF
jgi:hypothetical protein